MFISDVQSAGIIRIQTFFCISPHFASCLRQLYSISLFTQFVYFQQSKRMPVPLLIS